VRLTFPDDTSLEDAARALGGEPDRDALALDVPGSGDVASLRALLARLDADGVAVADLSIRTPDLDDVFLALTGAPRRPDRPDRPDHPEEALR
jgi:ABC-2 type transport system ATP-binding protein